MDWIKSKAEGLCADSYLKDEFFNHVLETIKSDTVSDWIATEGYKPGDVERREGLWRDIKAIERFRAKLAAFSANGRIATQKLNDAN